MTLEPLGQHVGSNEVIKLSRGDVAPLVAGSETIRDHDAQTSLGQMADDMGADKPGAAGNDDQIVAGQALHRSHDVLSKAVRNRWHYMPKSAATVLRS